MTTTSRPWILLSAAIAAGLTPPCACTAHSRRIPRQHLALLAGDCGYNQSHLIHAFRQFADATPQSFVRLAA